MQAIMIEGDCTGGCIKFIFRTADSNSSSVMRYYSHVDSLCTCTCTGILVTGCGSVVKVHTEHLDRLDKQHTMHTLGGCTGVWIGCR